MNRRRSAGAAEDLDQDDALSVAQSLQEDFIGLIATFDRQLANGSVGSTEARAKILDAKGAAQRGLSLSQELSELLRTVR